MGDSENIENLVGLLKKVESKQKREEFEKYKKIKSEIDLEVKSNILKFYELGKKLERKTISEINNEYSKEENRSFEMKNKIKKLEQEYKTRNIEYEKKKKALQIRGIKLKKYYNSQIEIIEEQERKELKELKKEMKNLLLIFKKEACLFSKNNIGFRNNKIYNIIKQNLRI
ncbi:hypothetical protein FG386_002856 [Cryptosporidium ryanae]|uniref:uncharacterized protein n=1 Tax=Cryptosporidium ryanae TaxID=515981 RepID=UPI00351AA955|nr:hypothetical protein FG386_002856 [Cryptosporidium ryanae]